jgi:hypothetical protein
MKTGYLIQIHAKGENRKCKNCRRINITNPLIKILGNLIKNWIEKCYIGNEEQSGFTKGRPTVGHIYVIRQILEKCNMQQEILVWHCMTWKRLMTEYQENYYGKPSERQMLNNQLYKLLEIYITITNAE